MKQSKFFVYTIFLFSIFVMLSIIFVYRGNVYGDIYKLIHIQQPTFLKTIQQDNAKSVTLLSTNLNLFKTIKNNEIFESFTYQENYNTSLMQTLQSLNLATLNPKTYNEILHNPKQFFTQNAQMLFNPFNFHPIKEDFLNFSSYSTLFSKNHFTLDFNTHALFTTHNGKTYYLAHAKLKNNLNPKDIVRFYNTAKQKAKQNGDTLLISGNEIFVSLAKEEGNKESIVLGGLSLLLIGILLHLAFRSWQILKLIYIVFFSFLSGLSAAFIILNSISLLSIVVSVSLIGLILDFSMHFLGHMQNKAIHPNAIKPFLRIFFLGFLITSSGYALFALTPMVFLREIAIISIFSLLGALLSTYFLLPLLLSNISFRPTRIFEKFLNSCINTFQIFTKKRKSFFVGIIATFMFCGAFFIYKFPTINWKDNIKNYSSINVDLLQETQEILEITHTFFPNHFLTLTTNQPDKIAEEKNIINSLGDKIKDYQSVSRFFLSQQEQNNLKKALQNYSQDPEILEIYTNLGISPHIIQNALLQLSQTKILSLDEIAKIFPESSNPIKPFLVDSNTLLIFLQPSENFSLTSKTLSSYNTQYFNLTESINEGFTTIKYYAIFLKIFAYLLAFFIFYYLFGFFNALLMLIFILLSTLISISILLVLGVDFNIFSIFGLILASTIGVDYILFAMNRDITLKERYFGILLANLTSLISFSLLILSNTYAIFSFGISTSLCMFFCAFFALFLAAFKEK